MDRNGSNLNTSCSVAKVALRKESVDRNFIELSFWEGWGVALRKESVDRNDTMQIIVVVMHASLSARRAWIEIKELSILTRYQLSLSARRAWIEIESV